MRATLGQHRADLAFGVVAEHEMRRGNELEVFHGNRLPWFRDAAPPTFARKQHDALSIALEPGAWRYWAKIASLMR